MLQIEEDKTNHKMIQFLFVDYQVSDWSPQKTVYLDGDGARFDFVVNDVVITTLYRYLDVAPEKYRSLYLATLKNKYF